MAKKSVEAPKGFHWMKSGKGFKLMKNPAGGYKPHKGSSLKAWLPTEAEKLNLINHAGYQKVSLAMVKRSLSYMLWMVLRSRR